MYNVKMIEDQIIKSGVRLGDGCSIMPTYGNKKAFTLNRKRIDLISHQYRPVGLSLSYIELPKTHTEKFHYRLELEHSQTKDGRFVLKTMEGRPFLLNGSAAREAFVERLDRLYIDENKINFVPFDLHEMTKLHFEHPILMEQNLLESELKILICGETGTGKTHLAKKIHERSGKSGRFVAINLSSFNAQLIESELFGHKKGSFTGALKDKTGAFSQAEEGTLFIDEIDSLPLDLQTKLLTFIDEKKFRRVGDMIERKINVRLIFASGTPLDLLVERRTLRKDLYFRLKAGHSIELASLRNDVVKIKEACQFYSLEHGLSLSSRLVDFYLTLAWPGNLRQLFGHLEKKRILSKATKLDFDQLDEDLILQSSDLASFERMGAIEAMEKIKVTHLKKALVHCNGNIAMTAKKLELSEKTVRSLMSKI